jgi:glycosyltransferase involved in cell wall biosynthesis
MSYLFKRKISYFSSVVLGEPTGPGVNELEFISDIQDLKCLHMAICPLSETLNKTDIKGSFKTSKNRILDNLLVFIISIKNIKSIGSSDVIFFRINGVYLLWYMLVCIIKFLYPNVRIHIKSIGVGYLNAALFSKLPIRMFVLKKLFKLVSSFDTPSHSALKLYKKAFDSLPECQVIGNGVSQRFFNVFNPNRKDNLTYTFGYVGRLPLVRGGRQVIEIVSSLNTKLPNLNFIGVITGNSEEIYELIELAKSKNIIDKIMFIGILDPSRIPNVLSNLDFGLSIVENVNGTSAQKLRQYCGSGVIPIFMNDDFFREAVVKSSIEYTDLNDCVEKLSFIIKSKTLAVMKKDVHDWALENICFKKLNTHRLNFALGIHETPK